MPDKRSWTDKQLTAAVQESHSYRAVIKALGLVPAGGNYTQITRRISELSLDTAHFRGKGWNVGWKFDPRPKIQELDKLLVNGSEVQSYKLKNRLFAAGLKSPICELCGWAKLSTDGRLPLELDHINGVRNDNRITNLRILCPNCHSLQPTHRGKNKKVKLARVL